MVPDDRCLILFWNKIAYQKPKQTASNPVPALPSMGVEICFYALNYKALAWLQWAINLSESLAIFQMLILTMKEAASVSMSSAESILDTGLSLPAKRIMPSSASTQGRVTLHRPHQQHPPHLLKPSIKIDFYAWLSSLSYLISLKVV